MQWKFWNRKKLPATHGSNGSDGGFPGWLPLAGSQKELIALQRTVGNQVVLKLLTPEPPANGKTWRWPKRSRERH
jgi:hypothetical protein